MTDFDIGAALVLSTGTDVEVLTRFEPHWTTGFEIASVDLERNEFTLRRHSDGAVLPASFSARELRPRR
jgi:hypothetical protein